jgi:hypothetical protein
MVSLPAAIAVTTPVEEPIVPTDGFWLTQAPPLVPSVSVSDCPVHRGATPDIDKGDPFTVTAIVEKHVLLVAYVIIAVPAATPVTIPEVPVVATDVLPLDQLPPVVEMLNGVVRPEQTTGVPEIDAGVAYTVTVVLVPQPPTL